MKYNKGRRLRRYYFSNTSTLLLPFFFITLSLLIFVQQFPSLSIRRYVLEDRISDALGIYSILISAIVSLFFLLRNIIKKIVTPISLEKVMSIVISNNEDMKLIPLEEQQDTLRKFFSNPFNQEKKYMLFVGESGSGKSRMVGKYASDDEKNVTVFIPEDYLARKNLDEKFKKIKEKFKNENIVNHLMIFDQFERALVNQKIFRYIMDFLNESHKLAICAAFVCMYEDYAQILKKLQFKLILETGKTEDAGAAKSDVQTPPSDYFHSGFPTYFLQTSQKERKYILRSIEDKLGLSEGDERYNFFYRLVMNNPDSAVSMIEINSARGYFAEGPQKDEYDKIINQDNAVELIIEEYFKKVFAGLEEPDLAMVILYSLCNCDYSEGLTVRDFQNLTFATKEDIEKMLDTFVNKRIIEKIYKEDDKKNIYPYIITHDYMIKCLENYCSRKLSEQIVTNIRFYCAEKKHNKTVKDGIITSDDVPLSSYYKSAINKEGSSKFINFCMTLLCIAIFSVCAIQEILGHSVRIKLFENTGYKLHHTILAFTIIAVGCAVFYIYHYLFYFAKIFFYKAKSLNFWICGLLIPWGMTACVSALLINEYWAIWLAIEWMIIGILHSSLSGKISKNDKVRDKLRGEGFLYIVTSCALIALNLFVVKFIFATEFLQVYIMSFCLVVFIIFVFFTIRQHINTDFILAKLGNFVIYSFKDETK